MHRVHQQRGGPGRVVQIETGIHSQDSAGVPAEVEIDEIDTGCRHALRLIDRVHVAKRHQAAPVGDAQQLDLGVEADAAFLEELAELAVEKDTTRKVGYAVKARLGNSGNEILDAIAITQSGRAKEDRQCRRADDLGATEFHHQLIGVPQREHARRGWRTHASEAARAQREQEIRASAGRGLGGHARADGRTQQEVSARQSGGAVCGRRRAARPRGSLSRRSGHCFVPPVAQRCRDPRSKSGQEICGAGCGRLQRHPPTAMLF